MNDATLLGLLLAMVALTDFDTSHIGVFVKDLPAPQKKNMLELFQGEL